MYISSIRYKKNISSSQNFPDVHPFYRRSFEILYDLKEIQTAEQRETDWMIEPLERTLEDAALEIPPNYFFDVRTTEEFSCPAPEYYLLKQLNLAHTSPLSVKGMGGLAIVQALFIAEQYVQTDKSVLFCAAQHYHCYDNAANSEQAAVSFIASKKAGEYFVESIGLCRTYEDAVNIIKDNPSDIIYTDIEQLCFQGLVKTSPFLTQPLICLTSLPIQTGRIICISRYQEYYGYYILRKD